MNKPDFVYVIYIASTPEKVWKALTMGELTKQFWGGEQQSTWQPGTPWQHVRNHHDSAAVAGEVIESTPPTKLVMSWAKPADRNRQAGHSQVTFLIEQLPDSVQLTVIHDRLEPEMLNNISGGWPRVLSNLKSFLETGRSFELWVC